MIEQADLLLLSPHIILASASLIIMLSIAIKRNHMLVNILSLSFLLITFFAVISVNSSTTDVGVLFIVDRFSRLFMLLILAGSFIVVLMSYSYLKNKPVIKEEYYLDRKS